MKPAPFDYFAPTSTEEALSLLAEHGYDAKILAGGQSLVPTMNFRLAQPAVLVDINNVPGLAFIEETEDGGLHIGAMTRQRAVEKSKLVRERAPLLHETMPYIAHIQIRNRGTFGGSLAHADPAAELPAVAVALGGRFQVQSAEQSRWVDAADFYVGLFATDLTPEEILTVVELPPMAARAGWSMQEIARRHGDYAIVGVAAYVALDEEQKCSHAKLVFLSVGEGPTEAYAAQEVLIGEVPNDAILAAAAATAAASDIEPTDDIHASADYRRHLANVLGHRALTQAFERAKQTAQ